MLTAQRLNDIDEYEFDGSLIKGSQRLTWEKAVASTTKRSRSPQILKFGARIALVLQEMIISCDSQLQSSLCRKMCRDTRPTDGRRAAQDHDSLLLIEASATSSYRPIKLSAADKYSKC
ncbi:hypothetical protein EVAR_63114_1 [Eumeta japonica]|uniref:Uncharacterized protein n=1 Tax=Eumeta variegata TaxID=151549 RepID=A0A4C1ZHF0_EUMVA|nr:hypothetical protein EVAR_63114_1 [Eumeta japonica]